MNASSRSPSSLARNRGGFRWSVSAAALPTIGVALMPKVVCPLCVPMYAAVLGACGLGFLMEGRWLLPTCVTFLGATLLSLGWRAQGRRGRGPLAVGFASSLLVLVGRFAFDSELSAYVGATGLLGAILWNAWPRRRTSSCGACRESVAS